MGSVRALIGSILILCLAYWSHIRLQPLMDQFTERQLAIEPGKLSYRMWKDMPVAMYQSFTFFNLTNWQQVKSVGQKPRFVEVGPYVYRTQWSKSEIHFLENESEVSFTERKLWHFQAHLSKEGLDPDDQIWTINTPLMTSLALIQNAPLITRNMFSVILDGLGEGAFIRRSIKSLLFEGYPDLIVSVGPLFDRRFANFNGKFAYFYNKNDTADGSWLVSTGKQHPVSLNKIKRYQSNVVQMNSLQSGLLSQGLNEVKPDCNAAWTLDQATNGQLFPGAPSASKQQVAIDSLPGKSSSQRVKQVHQQQQQAQASQSKKIFGRQANLAGYATADLIRQTGLLSIYSMQPHGAGNGWPSSSWMDQPSAMDTSNGDQIQTVHPSQRAQSLMTDEQPEVEGSEQRLQEAGRLRKDFFYPDLCRPIQLSANAKQEVTSTNGIRAHRYTIDPSVFMNSTEVASNRCYEMNPRPALANALAATINSVTGANVGPSGSTLMGSYQLPHPFHSIFPAINHGPHQTGQHTHLADLHHLTGNPLGSIFERSNHHHQAARSGSLLNEAFNNLVASSVVAGGHLTHNAVSNLDQTVAQTSTNALARLGRFRDLFNQMVNQRMSSSSLPTLASILQSLNYQSFAASKFNVLSNQRKSNKTTTLGVQRKAKLSTGTRTSDQPEARQSEGLTGGSRQAVIANQLNNNQHPHQQQAQFNHNQQEHQNQLQQQQHQRSSSSDLWPAANSGSSGLANHVASDRWITQFRLKWPRGVFSIGQCQLGAPIYASLPHFLDADQWYLDQVEGLKPNRSLHEFYIDIESGIQSIPVAARGRLQINVATPELRFRNIPNAMIPVFWQELTFEMDKSVASLLFWSFTMSSTFYNLLTLLITSSGFYLFVTALMGIKRRGLQSGPSTSDQSVLGSRVEPSSTCREGGFTQPSQQTQLPVGKSSLSGSFDVVESSAGFWQRSLIYPRINQYNGQTRECLIDDHRYNTGDSICDGVHRVHLMPRCEQANARAMNRGRATSQQQLISRTGSV